MGDADEPEDLPLGTLLGQLVVDAQTVARAEMEVVRQTVLYKLAAAQQALISLAIALVLALGAATTLLIGLAMGLAQWIGMLLATLVVTAVALGGAALLARWAARRLALAVSAKPEGTTP
jgi:hypothetical protein